MSKYAIDDYVVTLPAYRMGEGRTDNSDGMTGRLWAVKAVHNYGGTTYYSVAEVGNDGEESPWIDSYDGQEFHEDRLVSYDAQ